jgi:hypothetical protein
VKEELVSRSFSYRDMLFYTTLSTNHASSLLAFISAYTFIGRSRLYRAYILRCLQAIGLAACNLSLTRLIDSCQFTLLTYVFLYFLTNQNYMKLQTCVYHTIVFILVTVVTSVHKVAGRDSAANACNYS